MALSKHNRVEGAITRAVSYGAESAERPPAGPPAGPTTAPCGTITAMVGIIRDMQDHTDKRIAELSNALAPILCGEAPQPAATPHTSEVATCPLHDLLITVLAAGERQVNALAEIHRRIQL